MSFPNSDLSPMNQNILNFDLSTGSCGAEMDRQIDSALDCFGIGWNASGGSSTPGHPAPSPDPCLGYGTCGVDVDQQCGPYRNY